MQEKSDNNQRLPKGKHASLICTLDLQAKLIIKTISSKDITYEYFLLDATANKR